MFNTALKRKLQDTVAELHKQQGVLQAIDRSMAVIEFSPDGVVRSVNANFEQAMGYRANEVVGQHHRLFCPADYVSSAEYANFWSRLKQGHFVSDRFKRVTKNGDIVWLEASYNPVRDETGQVVAVVKFALDVTKSVQTELEARNTMKAVSRSMAVIEFSIDGIVLRANSNFLNTVGYGEQEIIGQHHRIFCVPEFVNSPAYAELWQRLNQGIFIAGKFERRDKQGRPIWLEASYNPIVNDEGEVYKVIKFALDITEEEEAAQRDLGLVKEAHRLSAASDAASSDGLAVIKDTIGEMSLIADSAERSVKIIEDLDAKTLRITSIVNTIHEIADQTNLLALNAAIEAARAGEQGRGFAVVADEVRKLAERTNASTKEVAGMIDDIRNGTSSASESIHEMQIKARMGEEHAGVASTSIDQIRSSTAQLSEVVSHFSAVQAQKTP
ncbi:PAS domain-containing methyl-accepting chemotaxis protein [Chromobacterium aquaticum]|uniref:PAS domain-containing methyl-accepting chemotaxis protein n=1 Tax=Chromobacterium aquaticum TaxID=467180 RepID=A0ABV8ZRW8_9NEIS|nr:PAS domain-containing methyl-accepting chemotaxis protein [Chromobacterium aquaticum]MCD5361501.1 PAS domain-containing methyl-accepting chemotaxis protein [Chromobacterium aquaticum]